MNIKYKLKLMCIVVMITQKKNFDLFFFKNKNINKIPMVNFNCKAYFAVTINVYAILFIVIPIKKFIKIIKKI